MTTADTHLDAPPATHPLNEALALTQIEELYAGLGLPAPFLPEELHGHVFSLGVAASSATSGDKAAGGASAGTGWLSWAGKTVGRVTPFTKETTSESARKSEALPLTFAACPDCGPGSLSSEIPRDLYLLEAWLDVLLRHCVSVPFVAFGFGGHGFVSQAAHYYYADSQLVILVQERVSQLGVGEPGDPSAPPQAARPLAAYMRAVRRARGQAAAALAQSTFPAGQRLVIVQSSFSGDRWGWVPSYIPDSSEAKAAALSLTPVHGAALLLAIADLEEKTRG